MVTLIGVILPSSWTDGYLKGLISIYTFDDREYLIEKNQCEYELQELLQQKVRLIGKVRSEVTQRVNNERKIIEVAQYFVLNSEAPTDLVD